MSYGTSPIENQRPFADNAFRPGKGSRKRRLGIPLAEFHRRLDDVFKWSKRRQRSSKQ